MTMLSFIPKGRENAKSIGEIAEAARVHRRKTEKTLESLVLSGIPIIACENGVYLATSAAEVRAYAESLRGRIAAVQGRISALERAAERMESPLTLWKDTAA